MSAMARLLSKLPKKDEDELERLKLQRRKLASFCRLLGAEFGDPRLRKPGAVLTPRLQQTLQRLLAGDSEKQIASALELSQHTIHVYVKSLYRHYKVNSRGELLARFLETHGPDTPAGAAAVVNAAVAKRPNS